LSRWNVQPPGALDGFNKPDHVDHLLIFINPKRDKREGEHGPYVAALCDVVIDVEEGKAYEDVILTGNALAPRVLNTSSDVASGILRMGKAKANQNPPYLLDDPAPEDYDVIDAIFDAFATRLKTGRLVFDAEAYNAAKSDGEDDEEKF
jgi:hypothetical protein